MLEPFQVNYESFREEYILGNSLETPFGVIRFYDYIEYHKKVMELSIISFSILKYYYMIRGFLIENNATRQEQIDLMEMREMDLFDFLRFSYAQGNTTYLEAYMTVFNDLIENDQYDFLSPTFYFEKISHENFYTLRNIIMDMNLIKEEVMSPSHRVQEFLDKSKKMKNKGRESPSLETVLSSIFIATGVPYQELGKMTAYQILSTYSRIHSFKDFDMSTLFATVSGDIEISSWDKNNNFFEEEQVGMDLNQVKQDYNKKLS